jgi:hypothetical protein
VTLGLINSRDVPITRTKISSGPSGTHNEAQADNRVGTQSASLLPSEIVMLSAEEFAVADLRGKTDVFIAPGSQVRVDAIRLSRAMIAASLAASAAAGLIKLEVTDTHGIQLRPAKILARKTTPTVVQNPPNSDWPTGALEAGWPNLIALAKPHRGPAGLEACLNCLLLERGSPPEMLEQTVLGLLQRGLIRQNTWPRSGYSLLAQTKTLLDVPGVKHMMLEPARAHIGFWAAFERTFETVYATRRWRG